MRTIRHLFSFLFLVGSSTFVLSHAEEKPFVFVVPMYENSPWVEMNLASIFMQQYDNYRVIVIDDASTDGTADLVQSYVDECNQNHRVTLIRNAKRQMQLANRYKGAYLCEDDEIIVMLDGDDFLARDDALQLLNVKYQDPEVWLVFAQYIRWCTNCSNASLQEKMKGCIGCDHIIGVSWRDVHFSAMMDYRARCKSYERKSKAARSEVVCKTPVSAVAARYSFRAKRCLKDQKRRKLLQRSVRHEQVHKEREKRPSGKPRKRGPKGGAIHLRTFYARLFKNIKLEDLMYQGFFFPRSTEVSTSYPLLEMARGHAAFVPDVLMLYNRENPLNCGKIYRQDPMHARFSRQHFQNIVHQRMPYEVFAPQTAAREHLFDVVYYELQQCESLAQDPVSGMRAFSGNASTPIQVVQEFFDTSQAPFILLVRQRDELNETEDTAHMIKYMQQTKATLGFCSASESHARVLATVPQVTLTSTIHAWQFSNPPCGLEKPFRLPNVVCTTQHFKHILSSVGSGVMADAIQQWEEQPINPENICLFQVSN